MIGLNKLQCVVAIFAIFLLGMIVGSYLDTAKQTSDCQCCEDRTRKRKTNNASGAGRHEEKSAQEISTHSLGAVHIRELFY